MSCSKFKKKSSKIKGSKKEFNLVRSSYNDLIIFIISPLQKFDTTKFFTLSIIELIQ